MGAVRSVRCIRSRIRRTCFHIRYARRVGDDFSVFKMNGTRRHRTDVRIMGNNNDRRTLPVYVKKKIEYGLSRFGIERSGRLVGKNQFRTGYKGAGNGDTLLLTARQLARTVFEAVA